MDHSRNSNHHQQQHQHLGVNKIGKNIRKSPLHHPNYFPNHKPPPPAPPAPAQQQNQQPQPQVYNISKNDFRSIVQQLTGTPSRDPNPAPSTLNPFPQPRLPQPRPPSTRLQKIRPPPLTPIARPPVAAAVRPHPPPPSLTTILTLTYLPPILIPTLPLPSPVLYQQLAQRGLNLPSPPICAISRAPSSAPTPPATPSPKFTRNCRHFRPPGLLPSPRPPFPLLSPRAIANSSSMLPPTTPSSALPSPTAFFNLLSPRSPYPLLSPGFQYPPPLTPNFGLSPLPQPGILGAGPSPGPQPPPSPGLWFPQSPSGFLPLLSPRWRDML